ncbi:hypothetical protein [Desulfosporosinus hippei]|uniref:Uncharacterized protein n=1 Tax=Desulfosporosinus hippei DSM 8344 TaxID=1121419 RepID=A0A1G7T9A9_9FIRM|nr:hypothetical protein [Desulfosporosinus hippei]SDG31886.1 hypothetical protein SAMN05443529_102149 [Desulfosporosinus hippei DSM 8344]
MRRQTKRWVVFTTAWYVLMFLLIHPKRIKKAVAFGLSLGLVPAIFLNWITVKTYRLWRLPGDILLNGVPILACVSWIPPAAIFANYFPYRKNLTWKTSYILLFSLGTTIVQLVQQTIGMWENKKWKTPYTLPLAILTHTSMAFLLPLFKLNKIRINDQY